WTTALQPIGTDVFGLHHPDGYYPLPSPSPVPSPSCAPCYPSYLRKSVGIITNTNDACLANGYGIDWTHGLTEQGSSGSGLFTSNGHYLVGVLSCGFSTCDVSGPDS